jgi:uncharacterized protein YbjT (DUF2867 family)
MVRSTDSFASPQVVAVAGGTGFVGRALVPALMSQGYSVRAISRHLPPLEGRDPKMRWYRADLAEGTGLKEALEEVDVAFYLVHSMDAASAPEGFARRDRAAATRFVEMAEAAGVRRILYVGGLGEAQLPLSPHLASRREVGRILASTSIPLTEIRAAIVLGAGGSSFEMMLQLVEKLPVMICPRWVNSRCQPIALENLVEYLVRALTVPETVGDSFDVGGPEIWTYQQMLQVTGELVGRRPRIVVVPVLTPSLSAHWVGFITEVPASIARPLVEGIAIDVVTREDRIRSLIPQPLVPFRAALSSILRGRPARLRRFLFL